jgi:hypothetical protein
VAAAETTAASLLDVADGDKDDKDFDPLDLVGSLFDAVESHRNGHIDVMKSLRPSDRKAPLSALVEMSSASTRGAAAQSSGKHDSKGLGSKIWGWMKKGWSMFLKVRRRTQPPKRWRKPFGRFAIVFVHFKAYR